jgi:hypothetical protein
MRHLPGITYILLLLHARWDASGPMGGHIASLKMFDQRYSTSSRDAESTPNSKSRGMGGPVQTESPRSLVHELFTIGQAKR